MHPTPTALADLGAGQTEALQALSALRQSNQHAALQERLEPANKPLAVLQEGLARTLMDAAELGQSALQEQAQRLLHYLER